MTPLKTKCSHGIRAEQESEGVWGVEGVSEEALEAFAWKAGEGSQASAAALGLCVHFSDSPRRLAFGCAVAALQGRAPQGIFLHRSPHIVSLISLLHSPICGVVGKGRTGMCVPLRPVSVYICGFLCWSTCCHCL